MNGFVSDKSENIEVNYSKEDVIDSINKAINKLDGMKVESLDEITGHIIVKAGMSLFSWGESIHIAISENNYKTLIQISSAPKIGGIGANVDMGKNRRNIELIISEISNELKLKTPIEKINNNNNALNTDKGSNIEERLLKLKKLFDTELISEADYTKRKEEILAEI